MPDPAWVDAPSSSSNPAGLYPNVAPRIIDAVSRNITTADNGATLAPTGALTYTIPAGLSPMPSYTVDCPATGTISTAVTGGATTNGAVTTLTRTRAANPVGFVVLAHSETNSYGVSGS